ncbi:DUF1697 domain-containing protein [Hoeflea sp. WL0058]|uniref:DUF1697 domain-containing protein n=1 Tax=Flavimaribacter sediminis TaxID=2865987 RepID=A0AAE3D1Z5_9HYPH|nr:DUF1697 domain-containing protein [Flavimaribacter sediminis]MBW8638406.1 DUF1697 domain-containing protein [Flavimaribacter sediminis]
MATWVALLGSINVGGNNKLAMKDLRAILANIGYENVRTYIQSGNCVFETSETDTDAMARAIRTTVGKSADFEPAVYVYRETEIGDILRANPFHDGDPKKTHVFFLAEKSDAADLDAIKALAATNERFHLTDRAFYLHAPDGVGRSKLVAKLGKRLGVAMTARNINTLCEIAKLCGETGPS